MNVENFIESQYRRLVSEITDEYLNLYQGISHRKLKDIFSTLHSKLIMLFKTMNGRLPTGPEQSAHFLASPSRELVDTIEIILLTGRGIRRSRLEGLIMRLFQGANS